MAKSKPKTEPKACHCRGCAVLVVQDDLYNAHYRTRQ